MCEDAPAALRMDQICRALGALRVPAVPGEYDLHKMIAAALGGAGLPCEHEVSLGPRRRVDFCCLGVGIEVKKGFVSARALREQASKYLASERIDALILVTTRGASLPGAIAGKPVRVFGLNRLWGIALP